MQKREMARALSKACTVPGLDMKFGTKPIRQCGIAGTILFFALTANAVTLTNPIVFVTQPPIPREVNGAVSNTFLSVVTLFGNQQSDTAHAARGGDLWLLTKNLGLVNLTRKGGFGTNGIQHGVGIDVRDPQVHWSGKKVLFSMVVGAPTNGSDARVFNWQLYELTNLDAVIADTNTPPAIVKISGQPTNCNNVSPCYGTDGRIIFMSDRAYNNQAWLYPQLDEYKGWPTITGIYSVDPVSGDFKMLEHTPSGAFNPFIDSYGRLIITRWDHLTQDSLAADDRLSLTNHGVSGAFNFLFETPGSPTQSTNTVELFPEPPNFDTNLTQQLGVNGMEFNMFFPWSLDQDGGAEEELNHVGRHEFLVPAATFPLLRSFPSDTNLWSISNLVQRAASGVVSVNTNNLVSMVQIVEDPRTNGLYWGVQAGDISPFGGLHASGQLVTLNGGMGVNPTNMAVGYMTPVAAASGPTTGGMFRNPCPMSDGTLVSVYSDSVNGLSGWDTNIGTLNVPVSRFHFRLSALTNNGTFYVTNQLLTGGIQNTSIFWAEGILVTNISTIWELQPVEVRSRPIPAPVKTSVASIEQQVFADENVDLATFQADLAQRGLALVVSRNVTARDAADKEQPDNLRVPGGASSILNTRKVYDITHLQFLQADYLRGYLFGPNGQQPGRRVLATPMHATTNFNYVSTKPNSPIGGTEIMSDGSQATFIPANRAVTWQLTGTNNNDMVVRERYWISFRPGEVRTCANCHGINADDQLGRPAPTNAPLALRQLLHFWRTNAANAYSLVVSNGSGSGSFGAGSIIAITANPAPSGKYFMGWSGAGVLNPAAPNTSVIMPTNNLAVAAQYAQLPAPSFNYVSLLAPGSNVLIQAQAFANQVWILQASPDLLTWTDIATNTSNPAGFIQFMPPAVVTQSRQFYRLRSP